MQIIIYYLSSYVWCGYLPMLDKVSGKAVIFAECKDVRLSIH